MNNKLAKQIQASKYFQAIKNAVKAEVTEETKARVVANIEKENSREYQHQVASHQLVSKVMDDILSDPYWKEIAVAALEARKS